MPTYEYECKDCGHHFELFQKMTDDPVKDCPECKGKVKRLIGMGGGILFKGSGFHVTDYPKRKPAHECGGDSRCCGKEEKCESGSCHLQD
jgi:putative FmdB family regulatory protein